MEKNIYKDIILKQRIRLNQSEIKDFVNSLFTISVMYMIMLFIAIIYNSIIGHKDYLILGSFISLAVIYQILHRKGENETTGLKFIIGLFVFYIIHSLIEYLLGLYPENVLSFMSFKNIENTTGASGSRSLGIVTLFVDLIPIFYLFLRLAILGIFIKGIMAATYLEKNKKSLETINNG